MAFLRFVKFVAGKLRIDGRRVPYCEYSVRAA